MTLRELINSVDSDQYSDSSLYQRLRETKPIGCIGLKTGNATDLTERDDECELGY